MFQQYIRQSSQKVLETLEIAVSELGDEFISTGTLLLALFDEKAGATAARRESGTGDVNRRLNWFFNQQ